MAYLVKQKAGTQYLWSPIKFPDGDLCWQFGTKDQAHQFSTRADAKTALRHMDQRSTFRLSDYTMVRACR